MNDPVESAVADWLELQAAGQAPALEVFARERGVSLEALLPVLDNARWLVGRHQASRSSEAPALPRPPFPLDGVQVLAEAGRGGMGVVFRGTLVASGQTVAVKVCDPSLYARGAQVRARFLREAAAAARLSHRNVVRILQVGETNGLAWFAMEWVEGETLAAVLARSGTGPGAARRSDRYREVAVLMAKVARGLQHAHDAGLLHRDIKPGNILVDTAGEPRLADFGLVHDVTGATLTGTGELLGSPPYMSPEQIRGTRLPDARMDVYGLGVTLYECLTFRRPFADGDVESLRRAILAAPVTLPVRLVPDVPPDLQWICLRAMAREREVRYPSAAALAADLEAFARGEPVQARPPSTLLRLRRVLHRHRWAVAAALAVVVVVAGVAWLWQQRHALDHAELLSTRNAVAVARVTEDRARLLAVLDRAIAAHPQEPEFLLQRVVPLLATGMFERAYADLARAQALSPTDPDLGLLVRAAHAAGILCAGKEATADDLRALDLVAGLDPAVPLVLHLRGVLLGFLGRWGQAEPLLRAVSEADRSLGAEADLFAAYQALGRMAEAWVMLDRFSASRESPLLWYHRCALAAAHRSFARARADLEVLERRAGESAFTAAARIVMELRDGGSLEAAEAAFARARAAADWEDAAAVVEKSMAEAFHLADRPAKAIPLWQRLLQRQPGNANLRSLLGITLLQLGDRRRGSQRDDLRRRGLAELERAAEDSRHRPLERDYHQGLFLFFSDRVDAAVPCLRAAVQVAPGEGQRWRPLAAAALRLADRTLDQGVRLQLLAESAAAQGQDAGLNPEDVRAQALHRQALERLAAAYAAAADPRAEEVRRRLEQTGSRSAR